MKKIFKWYLLEEEDIKNIIGRGNKHEIRLQRLEKRENNIETLLKRYNIEYEYGDEQEVEEGLKLFDEAFIEAFGTRPPVTPTERTGEWIEDEKQYHIERTYHCSECGFRAWGEHEKTRYCGGCGAKMKGEK